jgi:hypothetical protein
VLATLALSSSALTQGVAAEQAVVSTAGPLNTIYVNDKLACQVQANGDSVPSFFGGTNPGACGTFLAMPTQTGLVEQLNGPENIPAGRNEGTEYVLVGQKLTASGATSTVVTEVVVTNPIETGGLQKPVAKVAETDTYTTGDNFYETTVAVSSTTKAPIKATLYHTGDCFLDDVDTGYGAYDATTNSPECTIAPNNSPPARFMAFTPGARSGAFEEAHYVESGYPTFWEAMIAAGPAFPNTIAAEEKIDNGMGLSWGVTLPGSGEAQTVHFRTTVTAGPKLELGQPAGASRVGTPVTLTAAATEAGAPLPGVAVTFTVSGANPQTSSSTSNAAGQASFTYTGSNAGTDQIVASFVDSAGRTVVSNEVTETWASSGGQKGGSGGEQAGVLAAKAALPSPVLGKQVNVEPVSGVVYVKLPPGAHLSLAAPLSSAFESLSKGLGFIPLSEARQVPVGSTLDTTEGVARVTTATATVGKLQFGTFGAGIFTILQSRAQRGLTNLKLVDTRSPQQLCATIGKKARAAKRHLSSKIAGLLRGNAHGKFTTTGQYSAATVRGTVWSVANRCDGTLTQVTRGVVSVRDFLHRRTITLRAGHSYLAKLP